MLRLLAAFVGFSEGIIVGSAVVAFITLLDIVPRLAQLTSTEKYIRYYELVIITSGTFISLGGFLQVRLHLGRFFAVLVGGMMGIFVGLLAAALAEVTNVIPVVIKRMNLHNYSRIILVVIASGKVLGSLIYWIILNK